MSQISLFTPAIEHKERALQAMRHLKLEEARKELLTAKEIDPSLADLGMLIAGVEFLFGLSINSRTRPKGLAQAWRRLHETKDPSATAPIKMSRALHSFLESLLCQRVLELLPPDYCDFSAPDTQTLHVGYCYLALGQTEMAHKKLLDYLSTSLKTGFTSRPDESHPILWGYFGDASYLLNRHEESNSGYVRALFMDPQSADMRMLKNPDLRRIYHELSAQHEAEIARARLPIEGWLQGTLQIPRGNAYLAQFIQQQRFDHSAELLLYPTQRTYQFALCLYIDQSGLHGDIDFDARTEMQRLDGDLFRRYLTAIESRPGPERTLERW